MRIKSLRGVSDTAYWYTHPYPTRRALPLPANLQANLLHTFSHKKSKAKPIPSTNDMSPADSSSNIHIIDNSNNNSNNQIAPQEVTNNNTTTEKIKNIMEAASALTALNNEEASSEQQGNTSTPLSPEKTTDEAPNEAPEDHEEEEEEDEDEDGSTSQKKRFIPEHKKPDAALTFPEKVRNCIAFYFLRTLLREMGRKPISRHFRTPILILLPSLSFYSS